MAELNESLSPIANSLDLTKTSQSFCGNCDSRIASILKQPVFNDYLVDKQLSWSVVERSEEGAIIRGEFILDRFWCSNFKLFPSCETLARTAAEKLVKKLAQYGNREAAHVAQEASFKIGKAFLTGKCRWATSTDLKQKHTFIPTMAVISECIESSTKIRVVQIPNRPIYIPQLNVCRTYNSFIRRTHLKMSSLNMFYLAHMISDDALFIDFSECFNSLRLSQETSLQNVVFTLKDERGQPTYNLKKSDGKLHPLVLTHASFGCSDIPKFSQRCVERLVETYEKNCKGSTISHSILEDLKFICKLLTWVDDSIIFSFFRRTCEWAAGEGRFPPLSKCSCQPSCRDWQCPSRAITDTDLKNEFYQN